jgi:hypothetical protein
VDSREDDERGAGPGRLLLRWTLRVAGAAGCLLAWVTVVPPLLGALDVSWYRRRARAGGVVLDLGRGSSLGLSGLRELNYLLALGLALVLLESVWARLAAASTLVSLLLVAGPAAVAHVELRERGIVAFPFCIEWKAIQCCRVEDEAVEVKLHEPYFRFPRLGLDFHPSLRLRVPEHLRRELTRQLAPRAWVIGA